MKNQFKFDDGDKAFPNINDIKTNNGKVEVDVSHGMSLWSYFAAHAPLGVLHLDTNGQKIPAEFLLGEMARLSAGYADAMIFELRRRQNPSTQPVPSNIVKVNQPINKSEMQ